MTQNSLLGTETTKRYDIPLSHLDYNYVRTCKDVKELEKILKVLRSGDEGHYLELEKETEQQLEKLNPKSHVLRKDAPILTRRDLDKSELEHLDHDLQNWVQDMGCREESLTPSSDGHALRGQEVLVEEEDSQLPPVRSGTVITAAGKKHPPDSAKNGKASKSTKQVKPRSYQEWDKFDIDKELEKVDQKSEQLAPKPGSATFRADSVAHNIDTRGMTDEEKRVKAIREKDKGNEAFHSHDYEESIIYYTRSISIAPLAATYNNRALAYLRLSMWDKAVEDCDYVLQLEPENIKALLRRGTAWKGKGDLKRAGQDMTKVLEMEPNNKTAQDLMKEIEAGEEKKREDVQVTCGKGRRMVIEEVGGTDEEDNSMEEEIEVVKPDAHRNNAPLVNGSSEDVTIVAETSSPDSQTKVDDVAQAVGEDASTGDRSATEPCLTTDPGSKSVSHSASICDSKDTSSPAQGARDVQEIVLVQEGEERGDDHGDDMKCDTDGKNNAEQAVPVQEGEEKHDSDDDDRSCDTDNDNDIQQAEVEASHACPIFIHKALPSQMSELREQGNGLFLSGQYEEAIRVYSDIISRLETEACQEVNLSLMYSNRAACYLKTGNCHSAIVDCTLSLDLVPHSVKPLLRRAGALEMLEKYGQAYVDYKHVLSINSSAHQAYSGTSRCQNMLHDQHGHSWREKLPPLVKVSRWDIPEIIAQPDNLSPGGDAPATPKVSDAFETQTGDEQRICTSPPPPPEREAEKESKRPEATVKCEPAVAMNREDQFEQVKSQGNKHVQKGEYEEAIQCYHQCLEIFTDRAAIYTNRALCYIKLNKAQEAAMDCSEALNLEPNNTKAYYRRALARKMCCQYKDSLQDLLQLLRLEPRNLAAKREMEEVKGLYKKEFDQLKQKSAAAKPVCAQYKKRTRLQIEEVEEGSDSEDQGAETSASKSSQSGLEPPATKTPGVSDRPAAARTPGASDKLTATKTPGALYKPPATKAPGVSDKLPATKTPGASDKPPSTKTPGVLEKPPAPKMAEDGKPGRSKWKKGGPKETSMGLPLTPTASSSLQGKITPYEFIQHWNALKQAKGIQPYVHLLEQVAPDDLPSVISNKLDGHMLQIIIRCAAHDAQTGEVERAFKILHELRQVPRFSTVVMFLSNKDKQEIRKVLEAVTSLGGHLKEDMASVRKEYGIK